MDTRKDFFFLKRVQLTHIIYIWGTIYIGSSCQFLSQSFGVGQKVLVEITQGKGRSRQKQGRKNHELHGVMKNDS